MKLSQLDHLDVLEVMEFLKFNCSEVLGDSCLWRKKKVDCCEVFSQERTELGFCFVFNSAITAADQQRMVLAGVSGL